MRNTNHSADADDPPELLELDGVLAVMDGDAAGPTKCLGFACPMPSNTCSRCKLFEGEALPHFPPYVPFTEVRVFESRRDAQLELYSSVTTSRGGRQIAELNISGRMKL